MDRAARPARGPDIRIWRNSTMKLARVLAVGTALLLLFTGCARRNNTGVTSVPDIIPDTESRVEHGANELRSDVEEGLSRFEDDLESRREASHDERLDVSDYARDDELLSRDESLDESVAAAMSTDFSEIGALDATLDDGFPGGPVDDKNRPSGPLSYQQRYGKYGAHFIVPDSNKIFLTFDEGYENGYTSRILDILKEKNVTAVFFITYPYAKSEPALVKRMIAEGHVIGNHSTAHKSFPTMPLREAAEDILTLHDYVKANFGYEMYLFRPPEGAFSEQILALTQSLNYKTMLWSFAYKDYDVNDQPLSIEATDKIVGKAHPGEIMLLHAVSRTNTEILGGVIDQLRAKGYEFSNYFYLA